MPGCNCWFRFFLIFKFRYACSPLQTTLRVNVRYLAYQKLLNKSIFIRQHREQNWAHRALKTEMKIGVKMFVLFGLTHLWVWQIVSYVYSTQCTWSQIIFFGPRQRKLRLSPEQVQSSGLTMTSLLGASTKFTPPNSFWNMSKISWLKSKNIERDPQNHTAFVTFLGWSCKHFIIQNSRNSIAALCNLTSKTRFYKLPAAAK